jgi:hypothetical protein
VQGAAAGLSQTQVGDLQLIAPGSAAAKLFAACTRLDLGRALQINVPHASGHATPAFVGEGLPIAVAMSPVATSVLGPARKLAIITTFSRELQNQTPEDLVAILSRLLAEGAAKSLDAAVFSAAAASSAQPAGLLNGLAALPGSTTSATTADSAATDIAAFAQAMSDQMVDSQNMVIVTSPKSGWNLRMALGFQTPPLPILMSPAVPAGTAIALAPEGLISGFDGEPEVEVSTFPTLHFDDSAPADIVGSAGAVAAPAMSTFQ